MVTHVKLSKMKWAPSPLKKWTMRLKTSVTHYFINLSCDRPLWQHWGRVCSWNDIRNEFSDQPFSVSQNVINANFQWQIEPCWCGRGDGNKSKLVIQKFFIKALKKLSYLHFYDLCSKSRLNGLNLNERFSKNINLVQQLAVKKKIAIFLLLRFDWKYWLIDTKNVHPNKKKTGIFENKSKVWKFSFTKY